MKGLCRTQHKAGKRSAAQERASSKSEGVRPKRRAKFGRLRYATFDPMHVLHTTIPAVHENCSGVRLPASAQVKFCRIMAASTSLLMSSELRSKSYFV